MMIDYLTKYDIDQVRNKFELKSESFGSPNDTIIKVALEVTQLRKELERLQSIINKQ